MFGLSGRVLEWFRSYMEQRSQKVSVHGILSDVQFLLSDVPQVQRYGVKYLLYSDETELYTSLDPDNELFFSSFLKVCEHYVISVCRDA